MSGENTEQSWNAVELEQIKSKLTDTIIRDVIPEVIQSLLPAIKEEITSKFIPQIKREMGKLAVELYPRLETEVTNELSQRHTYKKEAEKFMEKNKAHFKELYKHRQDYYHKGKRCEKLVELYDEGLNSTPIYIPKQYRHDKYKVNSSLELEIVKNREFNGMKSEIELLKLRELNNIRKVEDIDDKVRKYINEKVPTIPLRQEIYKIWENTNNERSDSSKKYWRKKIESLKRSYEKDKSFILQHNQTRVPSTTPAPAPTPAVPVASVPADAVSLPTVQDLTPDPALVTIPLEYDPVTDDEYMSDDEEEDLIIFPNTQDNLLVDMMADQFQSEDDVDSDDDTVEETQSDIEDDTDEEIQSSDEEDMNEHNQADEEDEMNSHIHTDEEDNIFEQVVAEDEDDTNEQVQADEEDDTEEIFRNGQTFQRPRVLTRSQSQQNQQ